VSVNRRITHKEVKPEWFN